MNKRIMTATLLGVGTAIFCYIGGTFVLPLLGLSVTGLNTETVGLMGKIFNRVLIGFMIGLVTLKMNVVVRGGMIGFILGMQWIFTFEPDIVIYSIWMFWSIAYGVLIDWLTTSVFKQKG